MPQSGFIESDGQPARASSDLKRAVAERLWRGCRGCAPQSTAVLRAGLALCLLMLAVAAPDSASRPGVDFPNAGSNQITELAKKHSTCSRSANPVPAAPSADIVFRRRDLAYRKIELRLLERRYAQLKQGERHSNSQRRRRLLDPFSQYQRWLTALSVASAANGIALPGLTYNDIDTGLSEEPDDVSPGEAAYPASGDAGSTSDAGSSPTDDEKGALALSGGAAAATDKVTVDADGGMELYFAPNWSFIASFDGKIRPQPQLYAGSGTLQYNW
jgi:hypothetical protein